MNCIEITKQNQNEYIDQYDILICLLRSSRNKAKQLAILEMSIALSAMGGVFIKNGPLGDVKGLISFFVKREVDDKLISLLKNIGYCNKFYKLDFTLKNTDVSDDIKSINKFVWKGLKFNILHFYSQSTEEYKEQSIENRLFALYNSDETIKYVKGYRGDGTEAGKRGLPVEDIRLMVNIIDPYSIRSLLDPFAGSGGILHGARYIRNSLFLLSIDIDKTLEPGLKIYSDVHYVSDAREVDIIENPVDAIVTEIPFSHNYTDIVIQAFHNLKNYITEKGKILCMCHSDQFLQIKEALQDMNFYLLIDKEVNRKGTPVFISFWSKDQNYYKTTKEYFNMLQLIK